MKLEEQEKKEQRLINYGGLLTPETKGERKLLTDRCY
jgi:hypothetical protein